MRFREVSRRTAEQLDLDGPMVEYVVEGWLRVAMRLLADGTLFRRYLVRFARSEQMRGCAVRAVTDETSRSSRAARRGLR